MNIEDGWISTNPITLNNLIKSNKLTLKQSMVRTSIVSLESKHVLQIVNLGGFRIKLNNLTEIAPTIAFLKTL